MKLIPNLLTAAVLAAIAVPAYAEIAIDVIGDNEVSLEGLFQADGNWYDNDVQDLNAGALTGNGGNGKDSEFELRRAEVVLRGKSINYDWVLGYDAKADKFLDTNLKWKFSSVTSLTLGQYKQPNSLEELTSTKNNDFISKAVTTNTFGIARRLGGQFQTGGDSWTITGSAFGRELTRQLAHGSGFGARATWAPIMDSGNVLHLGLSAVDFDTDADTVRIRARPDADLANTRLVDTGNLTNTDHQRTYGVEGLWITGPFKLQGEYMTSDITRYSNGNALQSSDFNGDSWYVYGVWNITGETWGYKAGLPSTPLPNDPAAGMWQVGLRYDTIDLNDGDVLAPLTPTGAPRIDGVLGGEQDTITAGVNYYWRSNFKFMVNYVAVTSERYNNAVGIRRNVDDDPNVLEARLQFYW